jgi:hypothetical protein
MRASQAALFAHCVLTIRMHHQWEAFLVTRAQAIQPLLLAARKTQAVSVTEVTVVPMVARVMPALLAFTRTQQALPLAPPAP